MDRQIEEIGLELEEGVGPRHAAVGADFSQGCSQVCVHGLDQVGDLKRDSLQGGAGEVGHAGGTGEAEDRAARFGLPVRGTQAGQGRDKDHLVGRIRRERKRVDLGGRTDRLEPVSEPLHGRAGDEDAAFQRVLRRTGCERGGERRDQAPTRRHDPAAGMGQQEGSGAVSTLHLPGGDTALTDQRRLLVAGNSRDRESVRKVVKARRFPELSRAWANFRQ